MAPRPGAPLTGSVTIRCPIATVFGFLSQIDTLPAWDLVVLDVERHSDGLVGLGTRFEATINLPSGATRSLSMVIAYEPPYQIGWLCELGGERESTRMTLELAGDATLLRIRRLPATLACAGTCCSTRFDAGSELIRLESSLRRLRELLEGDHDHSMSTGQGEGGNIV